MTARMDEDLHARKRVDEDSGLTRTVDGLNSTHSKDLLADE